MDGNFSENWEQTITYHFVKSKDVYSEEGIIYITVFVRLSKEYQFPVHGRWHTHIETVWVELEDMREDHAPEDIKCLPNCVQQFQVSENIFDSLYVLAETSAKELFNITPISQKCYRQSFLPLESRPHSSST